MKTLQEISAEEQYWSGHDMEETLSAMLGQTFDKITGGVGDDELVFENDTLSVCFFHQQDCCECVSIADIAGDLEDLLGSEIVRAEERSESGDEDYGTYTYTFYEFSTNKGSVTIRWYGSSNGYYSEYVDVVVRKK